MALKLEAAFGLEPAMLLAMQTDRNLAKVGSGRERSQLTFVRSKWSQYDISIDP